MGLTEFEVRLKGDVELDENVTGDRAGGVAWPVRPKTRDSWVGLVSIFCETNPFVMQPSLCSTLAIEVTRHNKTLVGSTLSSMVAERS